MRPRAYIAIVGLFLVPACSQPVTIKEKAYYAAHAEERSSEISDCRNDPGGVGRTPNCVNASAAAADVESARFWATKKPKSRLTNPGGL